MVICLGIESTAHTIGIAVAKEENNKIEILSNKRELFTTEEGGMIPHKVSSHHAEVFDKLTKEALSEAKIKLNEIDFIAFSRSPGLGPTLKIGRDIAKTLGLLLKKPIVGVNHCIAHLEIGRTMTGAKDPVMLYASGVNTQIIAYEGKKYRIFGETLDMGIGNFIDSFARLSKIGFPGGPKIEKLAKQSNNYIELPYNVKGMDVSFAGMYTNLKQKLESKKYELKDLAYSLQETAFAMLVEVAERAMAHTGKKELVLGGGVACNKRLQEMCKIMCEERDAKFYVPENQYLVDNAAMIADLGIKMFKAGIKQAPENISIDPYERTDEVVVKWRE